MYFARQYAHHAIHMGYLSADGKRLGFQLHNVLGNPGRKIEFNVGDARLIRNLAGSSFLPLSKSLVPVKVVGLSNNVLLDRDGTYYDKERFISLLSFEKDEVPSEVLDSKENRVNYRKNLGKKRK